MSIISSLDEARKYKFLWVWKFLFTWGKGTRYGHSDADVGYYPDYENPRWLIEFRKFEVKKNELD